MSLRSTRPLLRPLLFLGLIAAVACGDDETGPSEEQLRDREFAAREACIAERLALRAEDELQTLEQLMVVSGPIEFQRAYAQHANLRRAASAHADTALNHAATTADSARHAELAQDFQIRLPDAESVEANVIRSYESNFAAIYNDADHPCNWQAELESQD